MPLSSLQVEDVGHQCAASREVRPDPKGNAAGDSYWCVFLCFGLVLDLGWQQLSSATRLVTI